VTVNDTVESSLPSRRALTALRELLDELPEDLYRQCSRTPLGRAAQHSYTRLAFLGDSVLALASRRTCTATGGGTLRADG